MMEIVLSHISALEYYRSESAFIGLSTRCSTDLVVHEFARPTNSSLTAHRPSGANILDRTTARFGYLSRPVHVVAFSADRRCRMPEVVCHVCSQRLSSRAFVRIGPHEYAASPELCFVQMAGSLSLPETVALGYELCGTYSKANLGGESAFARDPLTSPKLLRRFASQCSARCGVKKAEQALRHIQGAAASPMETVLAMLLSLPRNRGGYGLPAPKLNHPVDTVRSHFGEMHGDHRICDLLWPEAKVAVEYDSHLCHAHAQAIARDSMRRTELANAGIAVVTVTKDQVYNLRKLDEVAGLLFKLLGRRLQKPLPTWRERQAALRSVLLSQRTAL